MTIVLPNPYPPKSWIQKTFKPGDIVDSLDSNGQLIYRSLILEAQPNRVKVYILATGRTARAHVGISYLWLDKSQNNKTIARADDFPCAP